MERFLIQTPHTEENCIALLEQINAQGYLWNFDWGCRDGVHTGFAIIEAGSEAEARLAVPPLVRSSAIVTRVTKFDPRDVEQLHDEKTDHLK